MVKKTSELLLTKALVN